MSSGSSPAQITFGQARPKQGNTLHRKTAEYGELIPEGSMGREVDYELNVLW